MNQPISTGVKQQTKYVCFMGLLFALAMTFSYLESLVVIPGLPPGVKLGLSNLVTMYCLFFLGSKHAYTLAVMKSIFVMLTRGILGGLLSLSGALFSVTSIVLLMAIKKHLFSYFFLSIIGAVTHNIGQIFIAKFVLSIFLYYTIPILLISGIVVGAITGILFQSILPYTNVLFSQEDIFRRNAANRK